MSRLIILATCLLMFMLPSLSQGEGPYEISWYTIDGGGGMSSGGPYVLMGTIGQPDADWSSGGKYELLGGFLPDGLLCIVEFEDFARLTERWLHTASGLAGDLDEDNDVDFDDLSRFTDYWLAYCPYGWDLK